jgi:hypothetical protein
MFEGDSRQVILELKERIIVFDDIYQCSPFTTSLGVPCGREASIPGHMISLKPSKTNDMEVCASLLTKFHLLS